MLKQEPCTRALLYLRVSGVAQAQFGVSLPSQEQICAAYAAARGWQVLGVYQDVASGRLEDRPAYQGLLHDAAALRADGGPVVVVVSALDRLGRRLLEGLRCYHHLQALGVPVHCVREGGELPELVLQILLAIAEEELDTMLGRLREVSEHITRQGWHHPGTTLPYGYRWRPATPEERAAAAPRRVLEPDPLEAPILREVFARFAAGHTRAEIRAWYDALPEARRGPRPLRDSGLFYLLQSSTYIARQKQGDPEVLARPRTRWIPLVDDGTWYEAQVHLAVYARHAAVRDGTC